MPTGDVVLRSARACARFSRATGALTGFVSGESGWDVVGRPELGLSFRLLIPLADRRSNSASGAEQGPPEVTVGDGFVELDRKSVV